MTTIKGFGKKALSTRLVAAFTIMLALALTTAAAAGACPTSITECGCTISAPGTYKMVGPDFVKKPAGTCIDITASNVTLEGNPYVPRVILGPGTDTPTFGIHIEASARNVTLTQMSIRGFGEGLRIDGPNATLFEVGGGGNHKGIVVNGAKALLIEIGIGSDETVGIQINASATNFVMVGGGASSEAEAGIELNGVSKAVLSSVEAVANGTFGIWLNGASNNIISNFDASGNGIAGVYLGCNAAGPNGQASCPSSASSNGNSLMGAIFTTDYSIVNNIGGAPNPQRYGMAVGLGSLHNDFLLISGSDNLVDDALDENPNCGSNRWLFNGFMSTSPPRNTTFTCIN
jgi:hypothetical protein